MNTTNRAVQEWIETREAAAILGIPTDKVPGLADRRLITRRSVPGCRPKYDRASVEALALQFTTEALPQAR